MEGMFLHTCNIKATFSYLVCNPRQVLPDLCSPEHYTIKHNVSSSTVTLETVKRTNLTIFGVQPGKIYYVEIIPYLLGAIVNSTVFHIKG